MSLKQDLIISFKELTRSIRRRPSFLLAIFELTAQVTSIMEILVITSSRICYIWASDQRRMRIEYATERFCQMSKIGHMSLQSKNSFDWKPEEKYRVRIANEEAYFDSLTQANKFMLKVKLKKHALPVSKFFVSVQKQHLIMCAEIFIKLLNFQRHQKERLLLISSIMSQILDKQKRALDQAVKLNPANRPEKGLTFQIDFGLLQLKKTLTEADSIRVEIHAWKAANSLLIHSADFRTKKTFHSKTLYQCTQRAIQLSLKQNYNVIQFLIKIRDRPLVQAKIDKLMCRRLRQRKSILLTLNRDREELGFLQVYLFSPVHSASCLNQQPPLQLDPLFSSSWPSPPLVFEYRLGCSLFLREQLWSDDIPEIEQYRQKMVRNKHIEYGKLISLQQRILQESANHLIFTRSQRIGKYFSVLGVADLKRTLIHSDQQAFFKVLALRYQDNNHSSKFAVMHRLSQLRPFHPHHFRLAKKVIFCLLGFQNFTPLFKINAHSTLAQLVITVCKLVVFSEIQTQSTYRTVFWIALGLMRIFGQFRQGGQEWLSMQLVWAQRLIARLGLDQEKVAGGKVDWIAQCFKLLQNCFAQLHMNCVLMIYDSLVAQLDKKPTLLVSFSLGVLSLVKQISKGHGKHQFHLNLQALLGFVPTLKLFEESKRLSQLQIDLSEKRGVRSPLPQSCQETASRMQESEINRLLQSENSKKRERAKKISILVQSIQRKQFQYILVHGQNIINIREGNQFYLKPSASSLCLRVLRDGQLLGQAALRPGHLIPCKSLLSEELNLYIEYGGHLQTVSVHLWVKQEEGAQGQQRNKKQQLDLYGFRFEQQIDLKNLLKYSSPIQSQRARQKYQELWEAVCGRAKDKSKDYPFDFFVLTLLFLPIDLQKRIILLYNLLKAFLYVDSKLVYLLQKVLRKHFGLQFRLASKELAVKIKLITKVQSIDITKLVQHLVEKHKQKFLSGDLVLGSMGQMSLLRGYLPKEILQKIRTSKSFEFQLQKHGKQGFYFKEIFKVDSQSFKIMEPAVCIPTVKITDEQLFSLDQFVQTLESSPFFLQVFGFIDQMKSQSVRMLDLGKALIYVTQHEVDLHYEEKVLVTTPYHSVQQLLQFMKIRHLHLNLSFQVGLLTRLHALPFPFLYGLATAGEVGEEGKECLVFRVGGEGREAVQGRVLEGGDLRVKIGNSLVKVSGITVID